MIARSSAATRPTGLTILEALVTCAIIIAVAGLGFAAYHGASSSVVSARTLSQLREIGVATAAWSNDNGSQYPPCWDNNMGRNLSYAQILGPYIQSEDANRGSDSKFIGYNKRLPLKFGPYSHPITFSLNRSVCRDVTQYGRFTEQLVSRHDVPNAPNVILAIDGCQNPRNSNQANASTYEVLHAVGDSGTAAEGAALIPVGPDSDTAAADGWIRYADGQAHALMCDGSAQLFAKGTIRKRNVWRKVTD